jgi:hypothetical protein
MSRHSETLLGSFLVVLAGWSVHARRVGSGRVEANRKGCDHSCHLCSGQGPSRIVKLLISGREDGGARRVGLGWEVCLLDKVGYGGASGWVGRGGASRIKVGLG